ncbi:MAG: GNAT family N-acetyltransferase [Bacteroidota bacterium]
MKLEVRPMEREEIPVVVDYFLNSPESYLRKMGVDPLLLTEKEEWLNLIWDDLKKPDQERKFFYIAWLQDGECIGHSNINKIVYGDHAYMHLHVWPEILRRKGIGTELVKLSLPLYFQRFKLERLYCEPFSLNAPPNRTLVKAGFEYLGSQEKVPGYINFFQEVNRYVISKDHVL